MTAEAKISLIQKQLSGFKDSLKRNHADLKLCAHIRERIGSLENEMGDLEVQLKSIGEEASHDANR